MLVPRGGEGKHQVSSKQLWTNPVPTALSETNLPVLGSTLALSLGKATKSWDGKDGKSTLKRNINTYIYILYTLYINGNQDVHGSILLECFGSVEMYGGMMKR